ncbi:MAG: ABC transporter permease subunit [Thermoplasmata archaeon]|nr:ABC transporter permease subunit [Thermoplasmata archaeon]
MTSQVRRLAVIVGMTYRGSFLGGRLWISTLLAGLPPVLLAAFYAYGVTGTDLITGFGNVVVTLILSVQLPLTALILGVGLFRTEIEEDTLPFLTLRTVARPSIVIGKYLGGWAALLTFLLPSFGVSLAIAAAGAQGASFPSGDVAAGLLIVLLGSVTYLAIYLLMGLVTRSAVILGLVYAFLWEFVLPLFPGHLPQITVYYYLRTGAANVTSAAPLGSYSTTVGLAAALAAPLGVAAVALVLACLVVGYVETAPGHSDS